MIANCRCLFYCFFHWKVIFTAYISSKSSQSLLHVQWIFSKEESLPWVKPPWWAHWESETSPLRCRIAFHSSSRTSPKPWNNLITYNLGAPVAVYYGSSLTVRACLASHSWGDWILWARSLVASWGLIDKRNSNSRFWHREKNKQYSQHRHLYARNT